MTRPKLVRSMASLTHKARDPFWNTIKWSVEPGGRPEEPMLKAVQELARVLTIYGFNTAAQERFAAGMDVGFKQLKEMEE